VNIVILHKGEVLFRQGEHGPLYRLHSGLLKVVRLQEDGTTSVVNLLEPGECFPHHSLLSPKEYFGTAIALVTCEVEVIPADDWYRGLERDPLRYRDVARVLEDKLRLMQQRIDHLLAPAPRERLRRLEEWFHARFPDWELTELLTQDEIGQLIGVRRETVNRLLRRDRNGFSPDRPEQD
jgi:CRP/FNR family cyclic AMP-dependent transcriptional regulator